MVEDKSLILTNRLFVALVTGKTKEYAIIMREDGEGIYHEGLEVVKLKSGGDEELIAKLPSDFFVDGPPWAYDPNNNMLYVLMKSDFDKVCDTLVTVNLTQNNSVHTIPAPIKTLYDENKYFVNEMHLVEWPPTTPGH